MGRLPQPVYGPHTTADAIVKFHFNLQFLEAILPRSQPSSRSDLDRALTVSLIRCFAPAQERLLPRLVLLGPPRHLLRRQVTSCSLWQSRHMLHGLCMALHTTRDGLLEGLAQVIECA